MAENTTKASETASSAATATSRGRASRTASRGRATSRGTAVRPTRAAATAEPAFAGTAEEQVAESARRGESAAAERADAVRGKVSAKRSPAEEAAVKTDKKTGVPQARSGKPLHPDPTKPPKDTFGNEPKTAPDLADNPGGPARARRSAFGGFPPTPITAVEDEDEIFERIRTAEKADVLYAWKADEKASKQPRQNVIDAINARLMHVQGPPLPPD